MTLLPYAGRLVGFGSRLLGYLLLPGHLLHEGIHWLALRPWVPVDAREFDLSVQGSTTIDLDEDVVATLPRHARLLMGLAPTLVGAGVGLALGAWLLWGGIEAPVAVTQQVAWLVVLAWWLQLTVPSASDLATAIGGGGDGP